MMLSKMHLLNNFLIGMFSICTLLCIIRFSWLALISWNVFVPYVNLYLIWSHLVWSYLILDLPILLGYFIFQSTDRTSWTSENMWLSLLITLDIPHPLAFLEKLMQVLQAHEGFEHEHLLNVNLSQWCEHNPLSCDFIDNPIFRSPIGVRCSSQRVWSSAQKNDRLMPFLKTWATESEQQSQSWRQRWSEEVDVKICGQRWMPSNFKPRFAYQVRCH